jgi:hypothetical protein
MHPKTIYEMPVVHSGTEQQKMVESNSHIRTDTYETGLHIAFLSKLKRQSVLMVHKGKNSVSAVLFHGELTSLSVTIYIVACRPVAGQLPRDKQIYNNRY